MLACVDYKLALYKVHSLGDETFSTDRDKIGLVDTQEDKIS